MTVQGAFQPPGAIVWASFALARQEIAPDATGGRNGRDSRSGKRVEKVNLCRHRSTTDVARHLLTDQTTTAGFHTCKRGSDAILRTAWLSVPRNTNYRKRVRQEQPVIDRLPEAGLDEY
jgi:hypothetical protein